MAATVTFDAFLASMAGLDTVNTGDGGFQRALGAALLDSSKLKSWIRQQRRHSSQAFREPG